MPGGKDVAQICCSTHLFPIRMSDTAGRCYAGQTATSFQSQERAFPPPPLHLRVPHMLKPVQEVSQSAVLLMKWHCTLLVCRDIASARRQHTSAPSPSCDQHTCPLSS